MFRIFLQISYLVNLLEENECIGVILRSNPPTVTLPRVKVSSEKKFNLKKKILI